MSVATDTSERVWVALEELLEQHPPAATDAQTFWAAQYDAGLAWVDFPVGFGGLGIETQAQEPVDERLASSGAPRPEVRNLVGVQMMAPTLVRFGTPEQCARHLRPTFTCSEIWCQLFSEPGAGSDLAAISTRAVRDGDDWIVNGQKVWTTLAHLADRAILLARTDPSVPKHAGLSFFLVDMRAPGVDVRPLRQITGEAEYNEVFLTDVRIPDRDRVGDPGRGWKIAMSTLTSERGVVSDLTRGPAMTGLVERLLAAWRDADDSRRTAAHRDAVVRSWVEAMVARWNGERAEASRQAGRAGVEGSLSKNAFGALSQQVLDLCIGLHGPEGLLVDHYAPVQPEVFSHTGGAQDDDAVLAKAFLGARALTIAGGTTEVNKNVVSERILGLPAEPRPDRDAPWHATSSAAGGTE